MLELRLRKLNDSLAAFPGGQRLFAGSAYGVFVDAPEFREDTSSEASLALEASGVEHASCALAADPLRRGVRVGTLSVPSWAESAPVELRVVLGGNTILLSEASVVGLPAGSSPGQPSQERTEVDLGVISSRVVQMASMTQVRLASPVVYEPLSIVPPDGPFDVYVAIESTDGSRFPFSDVLVGGSRPTWGHQDSFALPSRKWLLRIIKVAGTYYADLRAGVPGGTETDPDGAAVVSAEVNI